MSFHNHDEEIIKKLGPSPSRQTGNDVSDWLKQYPKTPADAINPDHYKLGEIECIDAIKEATKSLTGFEAYLTGNIMKYMWRWNKKNGVEDLKKAQWYLNRLIKERSR